MAAVTRLTPTAENWKGKWLENTGYLVNDTVLYGNNTYVCKLANLSIGSITGIVFPDWASTTSYVVGNVVEFQNKLYICTHKALVISNTLWLK